MHSWWFVGREKTMSSYFATILTPHPFYFKSRIYKLCWKTILHTWLLVKWRLCSSLFFLITSKTFFFVLKSLQFHYNEVEFLFFNFCLICSAFLCFLTLRIIFQQFWEILSQYHIHYPFNYILFLFLTDTAMLVSVVLVSSVPQLCPTLCDLMNLSIPGLPVHHQLPEFTQTDVRRVGDAIHPSHLLSSPSSPAPNPSQHQGLFHWVNSSHEVAKVLEFQLQHHSFQWTSRTDPLGWTGWISLKSKRLSRVFFNTVSSLRATFMVISQFPDSQIRVCPINSNYTLP